MEIFMKTSGILFKVMLYMINLNSIFSYPSHHVTYQCKVLIVAHTKSIMFMIYPLQNPDMLHNTETQLNTRDLKTFKF